MLRLSNIYGYFEEALSFASSEHGHFQAVSTKTYEDGYPFLITAKYHLALVWARHYLNGYILEWKDEVFLSNNYETQAFWARSKVFGNGKCGIREN